MQTRLHGESLIRLIGLAAGVLLLLVFWFVPPIPQDPDYHAFADSRVLLGIPNFWNVMSNLPFIAIGIFGLRNIGHLNAPERRLTAIYCAGLVLICFGSGWYHLDPDNASLVWDRLSMTISFMAFFAFVLARVTTARVGTVLLWPLIGIGFFSVLYWYLTERAGAGDLRLYAIVQFLPAILILLFLIFAAERFVTRSRRWLWLGLTAYAAAKVAEWQDPLFYEWISFSGHSLKHLLAALSGYYFVRALLDTGWKRQEYR